MRKFFWWIRQDKEGHERLEKAREENRVLEQRIKEEIAEDKTRMGNLKNIRARNNLADLFDDAYGMGRE
jgi:hypothetical protein